MNKSIWTGLLTPLPADRFDYNSGYNAYPGVPNYYTFLKDDDPAKIAYLEREKAKSAEKKSE
jgi:hypothetical protein